VLRHARLHPGRLVLGARCFNGNVPLRSRIGNQLSRGMVSLFVGHRMRDTQTGLRSIPAKLLPHLLRLSTQGYDFELDMLIATKHHNVGIIEVPIETIYIDQNRSSHFNPLLDSMHLARFASVSLLTALFDNVIFALTVGFTSQLALSQAAGRAAALVFNYLTVKRAVFFSDDSHRHAFTRYLGLVVVSGLASYSLIRLFTAHFSIGIVPAKLVAETLLFFVNFAVERDWVFQKSSQR
jgi:putative flippase GtrA